MHMRGLPASLLFQNIGIEQRWDIKKIFTEEIFEEWFKVFTKEDKAPAPGEKWVLKDHGDTLKNDWSY